MPTLDENSIDAIVTDPPYGLSFMGKDWDHGVPGEHFWREALRIAKPGAHLLAFGGTRTFHRLTCSIEDAGWEIRDCIMWVYGSGFPKSLDVSKAIDKAAGAERTESYVRPEFAARSNKLPQRKSQVICGEKGIYSIPATASARQWSGWGTALKPAWEPIILARKPLVGTVAGNVQRYGTGAINVDGCRIKSGDDTTTRHNSSSSYMTGTIGSIQPIQREYITGCTSGRWPANVIHDGSEEVVGMFPQAGGGTYSKQTRKRTGFMLSGSEDNVKEANAPDNYGDSGSAARFFYCAKASKQDRDEGCEGLPEGEPPASARSKPAEGRTSALGAPRANHHPTVKPTPLMRYLCRLVTPPGGVVLDPFMGSGSTGKAAVLEGFEFVGIELNAEYCQIARARIEAAGAQMRMAL